MIRDSNFIIPTPEERHFAQQPISEQEKQHAEQWETTQRLREKIQTLSQAELKEFFADPLIEAAFSDSVKEQIHELATQKNVSLWRWRDQLLAIFSVILLDRLLQGKMEDAPPT